MREKIWLIPAGEGELYVEDVGNAEAPALVFIPGGPGESSYPFRELTEGNLGALRMVYFDPRGCGRSGGFVEPQDFTLDTWVADLYLLQQVLGITHWSLLGHDFASLVALEFGRRFPEQTERVITVNPWLDFPLLAQTLARVALAWGEHYEFEDIPERGSEALALAFARADPQVLFAEILFSSAQERMRYEWVKEGSGMVESSESWEGFVANGLFDFDYSPYLADITVPLWTLVSEDDLTCYPGQARILAAEEARVITLPGAHYPWLEAPEEFLAALWEAMGGRPRPRPIYI